MNPNFFNDIQSVDAWVAAAAYTAGQILALLVVAFICLLLASGVYFGGVAIRNRVGHTPGKHRPPSGGASWGG